MSQKSVFSPVKPDVNLPAQEEEILKFWDERNIFEKSVEGRAGAKPYSFYDGPPFATGLPHYGHIMASTLKDIIPRYWTMKGYRIPRRFGWDCHGLPVEYEINKSLKLDSRKQIIEYGVGKYNAACRGIVSRYSTEWKTTIRRIGRWVDMENAYFTMNVEFMQSVWWVFSEMFKKGLIYEGYKVVPYSTGISTPLSNFEANLNYKQVQDPAITVSFRVTEGNSKVASGEMILAWTTTPWTLPSNLALAVREDIDYVKLKEKSSGRIFILAEALVGSLFKKRDEETETITQLKGSDLLGVRYEPLFSYFADKAKEGAFRVIASDHVTTESGTGVVHMAPAYGEDDFYACQKAKITLVNPVDDDGMFTEPVSDFVGRRVKDADRDIIHLLKQNGALVRHETYTHSYPFCWRSDTPLIYRAVSSWFVAVEKIKDRMIVNNKKTNWVPEHLRDGRFGNWLENARDWAISRNRFWGTPLPIWKNKEGEMICVSSKAELERLSGKKVDDLHIEYVDQIEIPSPTGKSALKRVEGVLDCWFESGSMPYAQSGYPFAGETEFKNSFPADFIAEGLDQTRGWFYTLMVIGTALFDDAPFRNVIVNGLILAEDGKKMSKSLRNYPDPKLLLDEHGADAIRLYLIDSPVVKAQELRFSEKGVREIVRRILLRWWNSYSFFVNYANIDGFVPKDDYQSSPNILDQWVVSRINSLIENAEIQMREYRLYNVVPSLLQFVEELTNTYIRFNRRHFWAEGMPEDKRYAYETLYHVLTTLSCVMAPFAPFLAETIYQNLRSVKKDPKESVHLESFPVFDSKLIRRDLEESVALMDTLVMLGRNHREKIGVKAKIPLLKLKVIHRDPAVLERLRRLETYFADELNVREVVYDSNEDALIQVTAKANFQVLGKRAGPQMKALAAEIQALKLSDILRLEKGETLTLLGHEIALSDVEIRRAAKGQSPDLVTHQMISIELDRTVTKAQEDEGLAREVIRKIQAARKSADLNFDDRIQIRMNCESTMKKAVDTHLELLKSETLCRDFAWADSVSGSHIEDTDIDGDRIRFSITVVK